MTQKLPSGGGSYQRQKNGGLKQVEKPTQPRPAPQAPKPATPAAEKKKEG